MKTRLFVTIPEFAQLSGLSYKIVRQMVIEGRVPSKLIGSRRLVRTDWAEKWLAESDTPTQPALTFR